MNTCLLAAWLGILLPSTAGCGHKDAQDFDAR